MKDLRKEKIERIEKKLLKANRVSARELREIVSAPRVFAQINARIKAEKIVKESTKSARKWTILASFNWQKIGLAFGCLFLLFVGALSLFFFTRQDFLTAKMLESVKPLEIQRTIVSINESPTAPKVDRNAENEVPNTPEKVVFKNKTAKVKAPVSKVNSLKKLPRTIREEPEEEFFPLAFTENLEEAKEDGKVIRVELSRSSLLALGLDPPMDDETVKVKTDLLIGSDGVARGIRFVK